MSARPSRKMGTHYTSVRLRFECGDFWPYLITCYNSVPYTFTFPGRGFDWSIQALNTSQQATPLRRAGPAHRPSGVFPSPYVTPIDLLRRTQTTRHAGGASKPIAQGGETSTIVVLAGGLFSSPPQIYLAGDVSNRQTPRGDPPLLSNLASTTNPSRGGLWTGLMGAYVETGVGN